MNPKFYASILCFFAPIILWAQNEFVFEINHYLQDHAFEFNLESTNNLDQKFTLERLQYYISEISIEHDGGQITSMDDLFILVDAIETVSVPMGQYSIQSVENLYFYVGVEPAYNHEDPNLWPDWHPLALHNPSMHWGWAGGYIICAVYGKCGIDLSENIGVESVSDDLYFQHAIIPDIKTVGGITFLSIQANYAEMFHDIDLSVEVGVHGSFGAASTIIENMRDYVFSSTANTSGIHYSKSHITMDVFPNPSKDGQFTFSTDKAIHSSIEKLEVIDVLGHVIQVHQNIHPNFSFQIESKGMYYVKQYYSNNTFSIAKISYL